MSIVAVSRSGRRAISTLVLGAACSCAGLTACTADQALFASSAPGAQLSLQVETLTERGEYLDAEVHGDALPLRFFALRSSQDCAALLVEGEVVSYVDSGLRGELRRGALRCAPQGFGAYRIDRGRTTRATGTASVSPRSQATYQLVYRDADLLMLRGRFPSATFIGWSGAHDTIAVIACSPACEDVAAREVATLEYRGTAHRRLVLLGASDLCPVEGLIQP